MIPFGTNTITLVQKIIVDRTDTYQAHVLKNCCSWRPAKVRNASGVIVCDDNNIICRIPSECNVIPKPGDIIVHGVCASPTSASEFAQLAEGWRAQSAFVVMTVKDNCTGADDIIPHYCCKG